MTLTQEELKEKAFLNFTIVKAALGERLNDETVKQAFIQMKAATMLGITGTNAVDYNINGALFLSLRPALRHFALSMEAELKENDHKGGWHNEAERRYKKGERQTQCPDCELYFFPDELGQKEASGKE